MRAFGVLTATVLAAIVVALAIIKSTADAGLPSRVASVPRTPPIARIEPNGTCVTVPPHARTRADGGYVTIDPFPVAVAAEWIPGLNARACVAILTRGDEAIARSLARAIDDAPETPSGVRHCPMDDGTSVRLSFSFPSAVAEIAVVDLSGCRGVSAPGRLARSSNGLIRPLRPIAPTAWRTYLRT